MIKYKWMNYPTILIVGFLHSSKSNCFISTYIAVKILGNKKKSLLKFTLKWLCDSCLLNVALCYDITSKELKVNNVCNYLHPQKNLYFRKKLNIWSSNIPRKILPILHHNNFVLEKKPLYIAICHSSELKPKSTHFHCLDINYKDVLKGGNRFELFTFMLLSR